MVEKAVLSKGDVLEAKDLPLEEVYLKEWNGVIYIKPITLEDRIKWEGSVKPEDPSLSGLTLLIYSACDVNGNLIFTEEDIPKLKKKNATAVVKLLKVARRVSKLREKDIEDEIKNSESIPPG